MPSFFSLIRDSAGFLVAVSVSRRYLAGLGLDPTTLTADGMCVSVVNWGLKAGAQGPGCTKECNLPWYQV